MKKRNLLLIAIASLIVLVFVSSFVYWFQFVRPLSLVSEEKVGDLCAEFSKIEGEISCQEAKEVALESYPGEVIDINKETTSYQYGKPPEIKIEQRDVWIVKIHLEKSAFLSSIKRVSPPSVEGEESQYQFSTEEIGVVVDRYQKEILFLQSIP